MSTPMERAYKDHVTTLTVRTSNLHSEIATLTSKLDAANAENFRLVQSKIMLEELCRENGIAFDETF